MLDQIKLINLLGSSTTSRGNSPGKDSLVAWWTMNQSWGARLNAHGNSNDLADINTVTSSLGKYSTAAQFSKANSEYLSMLSNASVQTGDIDFTIHVWVRLASKTSSMYLINKYGTSGGNAGEFSLYYDQAVDRFRFLVQDAPGSNVTVSADNLGAPSIDTWYLIIAWHDSGEDMVNIQVDNGSVDSAAWSNGVATTSRHLEIGAYDEGSSNFMDGEIDEVAFYKKILSINEKTWLYNNGNGRSYNRI